MKKRKKREETEPEWIISSWSREKHCWIDRGIVVAVNAQVATARSRELLGIDDQVVLKAIQA